MKNTLSESHKDRLKFEVTELLRDAAIHAEAAAKFSSPEAAETSIVAAIATASVAIEALRYARNAINGQEEKS